MSSIYGIGKEGHTSRDGQERPPDDSRTADSAHDSAESARHCRSDLVRADAVHRRRNGRSTWCEPISVNRSGRHDNLDNGWIPVRSQLGILSPGRPPLRSAGFQGSQSCDEARAHLGLHHRTGSRSDRRKHQWGAPPLARRNTGNQ